MSVTTQQVWDAIGTGYFGVLGFVSGQGDPRTAGVCYVAEGRWLYISTDADM